MIAIEQNTNPLLGHRKICDILFYEGTHPIAFH